MVLALSLALTMLVTVACGLNCLRNEDCPVHQCCVPDMASGQDVCTAQAEGTHCLRESGCQLVDVAIFHHTHFIRYTADNCTIAFLSKTLEAESADSCSMHWQLGEKAIALGPTK